MRATSQRTDIQSLLLGWAFWRSHGHGLNLNYPACTPFYKGKMRSGPEISDDVAGVIDSAVSRLYVRCQGGKDLRFEALAGSYLLGMTDNRMARVFKVDRRTARDARLAAESWVDSSLDSAIWDTLH